MTIFSLGEFFVLLLLLPVVLRPLLHKAGTTDRLSIFAPFAFFISILLIFADGLSVETISITLISFFVFFFNIRALVRCIEKLPVDLFSTGAKIACFLGFALICATGHFIFKNYPFKNLYRINKSSLAYVSQQKTLYGGSFEEGFAPRQPKQKVTAEFYTFKFEGKPEKPEPEQKFEIKTAFAELFAKQPAEGGENTENTENAENSADAQTEENTENTTNIDAAANENQQNPLPGENIANTENPANETGAAQAESGSGNTEISANLNLIEENSTNASAAPQKIIIYLPDVFTYVQENVITIKSLAAKGYMVICADFFDPNRAYFNDWHNKNFARSFYARYLATYEPENFNQDYFSVLKTQELFAVVKYLQEQNLSDQIVCIVADGDAAQAAKNYNKITQCNFSIFALNENIPGYVPGRGNLALLQPAVYYHIQPSPTDGWTQAQIIAQRVQKFIEKQENK